MKRTFELALGLRRKFVDEKLETLVILIEDLAIC